MAADGQPLWQQAQRVSLNWCSSKASSDDILTDSGSSQAGRHCDVMWAVDVSLGKLRHFPTKQ